MSESFPFDIPCKECTMDRGSNVHQPPTECAGCIHPEEHHPYQPNPRHPAFIALQEMLLAMKQARLVLLEKATGETPTQRQERQESYRALSAILSKYEKEAPWLFEVSDSKGGGL